MLRFGSAQLDVTDPLIDVKPIQSGYSPILAAFVEDTFRTCSFHRDRLERAGLTGGVVESLDDFARIPLLGPGEVDAIPDVALLPDRYVASGSSGLARFPHRDRIVRKFLTSSSTGRPKGAYYTYADWTAATQLAQRLTSEVPLRRFSRMLNCFHAAHVAGKLMEDIFTSAGCFVENNHHTNTTTDATVHQLTSGVAALGGFNAIALPPWRPPELAGSKGTTLDLLLNDDVDNVIGRQIETLVTGGAPFPPDTRLKERTWEANAMAQRPPATFIHTYGSAEVGIAAVSCSADVGLHVLPGFIHTEVIDEETGEQVEDGEAGLVVVTGLKHGSRYLRYVVGDEATYHSEPCRCGRTTPRLTSIQRVMDQERLMAGCAAGGY